MSFLKFLFASICVAAIAVSPAHAAETAKTTSAEVRKEITEAMDAIARYSATKRDEALERANEALVELDAELDQRQQKLRQRWSEMSESARAEARETSNELERRRRDLAEWYGGMKHGSQKAWAEIQTGFSRAYTELKKAWERSDNELAESNKG